MDSVWLKTTKECSNCRSALWLCFKSSDGKHAMININNYANRHREGIEKEAMLGALRDLFSAGVQPEEET